VSSGVPFFVHASPEFFEVVDDVAIFVTLDTDFLAGMAEAVCSADRPVVPAPKKMHNKAAHTTG
jgi:hypothetical protein